MTRARAQQAGVRTPIFASVAFGDRKLLEQLAWAGALSTAQVSRLLRRSLRVTQRRLQKLRQARLVRSEGRLESLHASRLHVLTQAGADYLEEVGIEGAAPGRFPRPQKRAHSVMLRDLFIPLVQAEERGQIALHDILFETDGRDGDLQAATLRPDLLVFLQAGQRVAIELDRGSESVRILRGKLVRYLPVLARRTEISLWLIAERPRRRALLEQQARELALPRTSVRSVEAIEAHVAEQLVPPAPGPGEMRIRRAGPRVLSVNPTFRVR